MIARTLIKLIDAAIFPAVLIVAAKIVSVAFLVRYFDVSYEVNGAQLVLNNSVDYIAINTYSSAFMFASVIAGLIWVTLKAQIFHDTHITPALSAKLFGMNMEGIIHDTQTIFSQAFVWLSYAWILTIIFGVQSLFGLSDVWLFGMSLTLSIIASAVLSMDVEREISVDRHMLEEETGNKSKKTIVTFEEVSQAL